MGFLLGLGLSFHLPKPVAGQDSVTAVAGDYSAGWLKRLIFGSDYRDLWATPIRTEVLDLSKFAGGLTPVRTGGYGQTISLHFDGADGKRYVFRSINKDLSRRLQEGLLGTFVEDIIQDQTHSYNPAAALVTAVLVEAAGVLAAKPQMFVMPDDPTLGEFREGYAGMLGLMMENPDEGEDNTEGFAGSTRVSGSDRVLEDIEKGPRWRVNAEAFLKARLMDIYLGDRDRHKGQWKWARFEEGDGFRWDPVAEDRDQPFVKQDGLVLWIARTFFVRKLTNFSANYHNLAGLTWNGWDLDRRFLAQLERPVWDSVATDLQRRLTDDVIEIAVREMPPPYYELRGAELTAELKRRRDSLHVVAGDYYLMLAEYVDIHATDQDEVATIDRNADGTVVVELALGASSPVYFRRTFYPKDTREIRLYLRGGRDRVVVRGPGRGIKIRVIGGGGADVLVDSSPGPAYFYDSGNNTEFVRGGAGTRVDRADFEAPPSPDFVHEQPPDWGYWLKPAPGASFAPDFGLFLGGGFTRYQYGFRKFPYSSRVSFLGGFSFGARQPTIELQVERREVRHGVHFNLRAKISGLEIIRFHGFGNETTIPGPRSFYRVRATMSDLTLGLAYEPTSQWELRLETVGRVSNTDDDGTTLLVSLGTGLYGAGTFGQLGLGGSFRFDTRDRKVASTKGIVVTGGGTLWGPFVDVTDTFAEVHGEASVYLTAGPTLALRAGGRKVFGTFPFQDAAYLGGASTLRGFAEHRFAGDAAIYGNAEFRFRVTRLRIIFPGDLGLFALGDVGRVYPGGNTLHTAFGGGVWLSLLAPENTLSVAIATSDERTSVYVQSGFLF